MDLEYHRAYNVERYHRLRAEYIHLLGGKCVICGSTNQLEFDHIDPGTKTIDVGKLLSVSKAVRDAEFKKCQLLCKSHHAEKSARESSVGHGGGRSGKKNCSCVPCKERKAQYMREYHARRKAASKASPT
jgi:hypothetical protein